MLLKETALEGQIRRLPPSVVNKIAAGEVIERPASVVKELVENALDAGATRIDVTVEAGGVELVRVADDGHGIRPEELELAVASHATSKLRDADDLFQVATLGFRGEALASIAEISRLTLRSRRHDQGAGAELVVIGGRQEAPGPCGCPPGTVIEVRQLFYNTPVRRKFLRSTQTEMGHVSEALTRLALPHPHVHFTLRHQERVVFDLPPTADLRGRVATFFGHELADELIPVTSREGDVGLTGFVAPPHQHRSHPRMQYFFLNGRHIRDRALQHALSEAYRGLLMVGKYPIAFLRWEMPAELVDVNVHPTKLEVRFQDGGRVYSQLLSTLRNKFLSSPLGTRLQAPAADGALSEGASLGPQAGVSPTMAAPLAPAEAAAQDQWRDELVQWARGQTALWTAAPGTASDPSASLTARPLPLGRPLELVTLPAGMTPPSLSATGVAPFTPAETTGVQSAAPRTSAVVAGSGASAVSDEGAVLAADRAAPALQVHNRYLIVQSDDGVEVIDQHALHERILYEQLRARVAAGAVERQGLLVPEPVDLTPAEAATALEQRELLARLGVEIEPFGGDTVLVRSYPAMLSNFRPAEIVRSAVEQVLSGSQEPGLRDLCDELLHMVACKAAIKAGDRLTSDEISALLQQRTLVPDSHHCPHGRPTSLVLTRAELDKQFGRT